ncbi:MAG: GTPase domain-containing protein [Burkholderiaceae bacterium]|nr:GTPase domain-containing protein [Burkholderiaceae bacterium]
MTADSATIEITLISHTNAGKTTLARTLLGRDIGEVRDAPHVTEIAEAHTLLQTEAGDVMRLWDTPGFGDSARLVQRLRLADNPIGWLLREVWDRYLDRPFWCSQQAVRAARDSSDVLLYLVSAAEDPRDAGYVGYEAQVLQWVDKPVVVLLNQVGPPRPAIEEQADAQRWSAHLKTLGVESDVLTLDAFARCWVQERVLLDTVGRHLPEHKRAAHARLVETWTTRNVERFVESMRTLAEQLAHAACDREPVTLPVTSAMQKLMHSVGLKHAERDAAHERAMKTLAERLETRIRGATDALTALHGLDGNAAQTVLDRLRTHFSVQQKVDEGRSALFGSVIMGALTGLKADIATGGLTLGGGMLAGGLIGGLTGAGVARGMNRLARAEHPEVRWSSDFLDALARSSVLRYLAVAHFGRGRGRYVEGEAPAFWREEVEQQHAAQATNLRAVWDTAVATPICDELVSALHDAVQKTTVATLQRLYPATVPEQLLAKSR